MYNLTLVSATNTTISGLIWSIFTYSAWFNSSNYINSTLRYRFGPKNNYTYYTFTHPAMRMRCHSILSGSKLLDCNCNCNQPIYGISMSTSGCDCQYDDTNRDFAECQMQVDCSLPAVNSSSYSYDSLGNTWMSPNLNINQTAVGCYKRSQQYMYSCTFNLQIGTIDYNFTSNGVRNLISEKNIFHF